MSIRYAIGGKGTDLHFLTYPRAAAIEDLFPGIVRGYDLTVRCGLASGAGLAVGTRGLAVGTLNLGSTIVDLDLVPILGQATPEFSEAVRLVHRALDVGRAT